MGASSATNGREAEEAIQALVDFENNPDGQKWLRQMGYPPQVVEEVHALDTGGTKGNRKATVVSEDGSRQQYYIFPVRFAKADRKIYVQIINTNGQQYSELISIKSCKTTGGGSPQHIARSSLVTYLHQWTGLPGFTDEVRIGLELLTGRSEAYLRPSADKFLKPAFVAKNPASSSMPKKERLVHVEEVSEHYSDAVAAFLERNKVVILLDALKGRGGLAAEWLLLTSPNLNKLVNINDAVNHLASKSAGYNDTAYLIGELRIKRHGGSSGTFADADAKFDKGCSLQLQLSLKELFCDDVPTVQWDGLAQDDGLDAA